MGGSEKREGVEGNNRMRKEKMRSWHMKLFLMLKKYWTNYSIFMICFECLAKSSKI